MTKHARSNLLLVIAGLLPVLTYLLVHSATPDAARHERTLAALRALILNDAALQRDVLKARTGLLRNYDPLVQSVENLHRAVEALRSDGQAADAKMGDPFDPQVQGVAAAVSEQENLVEAFKSRNALLQNSLIFLDHTIRQLESGGGRGRDAVLAELGTLSNAILRFTRDPRPDIASDVTTSLERLARSSTDTASPEVGALVSHGRLIVATLPAADQLVSGILATTTTERTRALQDGYLEAHAQAVARAGVFRILLYTASLALVAYVGYLFLRLRANARILRARLDFEGLIAAISGRFIDLRSEGADDGVNDGLARLATHAGVDRAHIVVVGEDETRIGACYSWERADIAAGAERLDRLLDIALHWGLDGCERQGCIHVPDVQALPESPEKSRLQERGLRSWLCIPMRCAGKRVGFLTLGSVSAPKHWADDDIAMSRTAGEIFANAIERRRSETERKMLEGRLHQAQRLEAIGTLAGGIAHEFNNILAGIFGYAELALATLKSGSRAERHVRRIMTAGERAHSVIHQILTFSRRGERRSRPVLARPVVAEGVDLLRASLPATVAIETQFEVGDAAVMADPTELQQVVVNLCTNGAHAMKSKGTLYVILDAVDAQDTLALSHGSLPAGRYIRLAVSDTGSGIDAATLERILEPFFTTKAVGQGTGLGLSTVHGIVTQHGGALNVESSPGIGSTFEAYFPRAGEVAVADGVARPAEVPRGNGETILIVDDDAPLVPLAEEILAALGYEPVGFDQSATALEVFRAEPGRFDLVLTDDIMPDMTGTELASAMHQIRPDVPIILMTGGGRPIRPHRLQAAGIREIIKKPLLSATIADLLARHLSARGASAELHRS
jgi:signal transduction histidine kinase/CheY-like chemotaxis protein